MARPESRGRTPSTREAILASLDGSPSMTAAELARALGLQPNNIRKHLRALMSAGLVGMERGVATGRGRPPARYRAGDPRRDASATHFLALALVTLLDEVGLDESRVEELARRAPLAIAPGDGRAALLQALTTMGFSPRETTTARGLRGGRLSVVL